jgi:histidinol-phosphate aminotransferase
MSENSHKDSLSFFREEICELSAYHVQNASGFIKLDAMENPFGLPEQVKDAWFKKLQTIEVNRYPDPTARELSVKLKSLFEINDPIDVLFGNGSDEIIQMLIMAVARQNALVMSVEPSFVMYKMIAKFCNVDYLGVDLKSDFSLDLNLLKKQIENKQPALIFIAQPNNPTGNLFSHEQLCEVIELAKGLVVIDEAYTAFTEYDALPLLKTYSNVLVMRTFSKTGLAGLRLGYLLGNKKLLQEIDKLRLPYNINSLTQTLAECALDHYDLFLEQSAKIIKARNALADDLGNLKGFEAFPSEANFITVRLLKMDAQHAFQYLKQKGILIKVLDGAHPLLKNCIRLTVGSEDENKKLLSVLSNL